MASPYDWSPESVQSSRRYGTGLMQQGADYSPVGHWTQAIARALQGGVGGYMVGQANEGERAGKESVANAYKEGIAKNLPMKQIAAQLMGNPFGQEQGQQMAGRALETEQNQGFQRAQQDRGFQQQMKMQGAHFGQQKEMADIQYRNAMALRQETDIVRNLRAAGIDPNSEEGRSIVRNSIKGGSPLDQAIAGMVQQQMQPVMPSQPQGQPRLQPQSFEGGDQPQMIPAQAAPSPAPAQPQPGQQQPSNDPTVQTPMGPMPQSKARMLGFALALQGKGDAGKMMADDPGFGKNASNDIDEKIVKGLDLLSRLESMSQTFQDKYQTIGTRLNMVGAGWMAKIDPSKVDPQTAKDLTAFAQDRRRGIENLNLTIKDITGAAMSIPEAQRIMQQVPNPGTGIFDGDDPVTYRAKLNDALDQTRLAVARHSWLKKNNPQLLTQLSQRRMEGVEGVMPLDRMRDIMNDRQKQIYQELKSRSPGATMQQLLPFVGQQLKQEFGI